MPRLLLALTFLAALVLPACNLDPCGATAAGFADKANDFFADVRAVEAAANDRVWQPYDERLVELVETCYPTHEDRLTRAQDRAFWRGVSAFYVQRYGRAGARGLVQRLKGNVQDKLREAADNLE